MMVLPGTVGLVTTIIFLSKVNSLLNVSVTIGFSGNQTLAKHVKE